MSIRTHVTSLDRLNLEFADRFNARDVEGLLALNAPGAVFVPAPGHAVEGESSIRGALEQFLALELPISMSVRHTFRSGDLGLAVADWTIEGIGPDGSPIELRGSTADVAVFDEAHGWRYAIDNPFGTA